MHGILIIYNIWYTQLVENSSFWNRGHARSLNTKHTLAMKGRKRRKKIVANLIALFIAFEIVSFHLNSRLKIQRDS